MGVAPLVQIMLVSRSQFTRLGQVFGGALLLGAAVLLGVFLSAQAGRAGAADQPRESGQPAVVAAAQGRDPLAVELENRLATDIKPLLNKYCFECHGNGKKKGGVSLDGPGRIDNIMAMADDWETVADVLNARLMPPEKSPQPTGHETLTMQQWIDEATNYYPSDAEPDPGWYTIHRLNRSEYRNTLRDLLGIDPQTYDLAGDLPDDDTGYGFDNIADVLSMSPLQLEKFLDAAERAVELAFGPEVDTTPKPVRGLTRGNIGADLDGGGHAIWANGTVGGAYNFQHAGEYELVIRARGDRAGGEGPQITVTVGDDEIKTVHVTAQQRDKPQRIKVKANVEKGRHRVAVRFINDIVIERQDRNLYVDSITVAGPLNAKGKSTVYDEIFFTQPTADDRGKRLPGVTSNRKVTERQAAQQIIKRFATRAFRRPLEPGEVGSLLRLYSTARGQGEDYESAVKLMITATLVSPNFLYRWIANPSPNREDAVYELSDVELATRLSYFLWSSMPDEELLGLAMQRKLNRGDVLKQQVRRMLVDPKSDAMVENFAGQWLLLRKLDGMEMDPERYPEFDDDLREAMRSEAELFFADVLRKDRSVLEFLDSDRTVLNETLAEHYGVRGVFGDRFREVRLAKDSPRGGVITMAAPLAVTSEATRTSPVKRGDYVLTQLMGTAPPPPPPDVPPLEQATEQLGEKATLREQLAAHVADPNCAVCHRRLDPIGLAMENFSATGAWRETEKGKPIDASGELPGGVRFTGPTELKRVMLDQHEQFVDNLSRKMLTYAIGRGTEPFDRPTIRQITQAVQADGYKMQTLIEAVVLSDAFRKARGRETRP